MNSQILTNLTPLSYIRVWLLSRALLSCIQLISIGRSRPSSRLPAKIEFSGHGEGSHMFKAQQGGAAKTKHSLANKSLHFYDWTQLSPGLAQRFKICLKEGLAYWYDGKASLALILCTLLAIIFNEVMPKSLRVMDRFRRFQGHRRLYYVDAFNSFWRLAYRSRHAGSTGHFDAVWIINGCKRKDELTVKCQSGSLALLLRQPGNLFRWGTSWDGWCSQILAFFQKLLIFQFKEHESTCESSKRCNQNPSYLLGVSEILLRSTFLEPWKVVLNDVLIILLS